MNDSGIISVQINGESVTLRFGMAANRMFLSKFQDHPEMLVGTNIDERGVAWLMWAGYQNACMARDEYPVMKYEQFYEYVESIMYDEDQVKVLQDIAQCYADSKFTRQTGEVIKKKMKGMTLSTGMSSNPSATENLDLADKHTTASRFGNTTSAKKGTIGGSKKSKTT